MRKAVQLLGIIALALVMAFSITGCSQPEEVGGSGNPFIGGGIDDDFIEPAHVSVTSVSLNKTSTFILINNTETLSEQIEPVYATNQNVSWSSSDDTIATVSASGVVTARKAGEAAITVTTADGGKKAICTVNVVTEIVAVTGVTLKTTTSIPGGSDELLIATVSPANATNQNLTWESSNTSIATVEGGFVKAKNVGTATITVKTADGGFIKTCTVNVTTPVFTSISLMAAYINTLASNTAATPYNIKLNVASLPRGSDSSYSDLQNALRTGNKYVSLDLSGSTFTSIEALTFYACSSLASITIPNSVTSIGLGAFCDCSSLTSVTIPNSVTSIGDHAFIGCHSLTSVTIGNSVTIIHGNAFYGCTSLTSVTIPNSVNDIMNGAFQNCTSLTSVTIGNSVTLILDGAFQNCSSLTSVTIPNSVIIMQNAFSGCSSLTSVTFQGSITSANFSSPFGEFDDLRTKYLAGGPGTYTRPNTSSTTWTKQ